LLRAVGRGATYGTGVELCRNVSVVDAAIAVGFAVLDAGTTLVGASWWPKHPGALAWTLLVLQALVCLSLALRRRYPLTVLGIVTAFTLAVTLIIWPVDALTPAHHLNAWAPFSIALAAYCPVIGQRSRRTQFIAIGLTTLVVTRIWQPNAVVIAIGLARTAIGPLLVLYFDARRRLVQALTERAERAERERYLEAERARADERARLAGEMHDVVTHRVSLMVLQAGALQLTAPDEATRQAAEELRTAGTQALDELRDLVGILRTTPEGTESPSTAGIAALVAESTAVGIPTELAEEGDPALASPVVGRTAYRIVREALTNVRKHAPGARVSVRVCYEPSRVRLTVSNSAPTGRPDPALAGTGSGLGIAGLRQRIEVVHGTMRAGPTPDGGFSLDATLPAYVSTEAVTP
jgi:signal transduction histidine kinase